MTQPHIKGGVLKYTHEIVTKNESTALSGLFIDESTDNLYAQFHNGTVSRREYNGTAEELAADVRREGGSLGKYWNTVGYFLRGAMTLYTVKCFERRSVDYTDVPTAKIDTSAIGKKIITGTIGAKPSDSLQVTLSIKADWNDIGDISDALKKAGYENTVMEVKR